MLSFKKSVLKYGLYGLLLHTSSPVLSFAKGEALLKEAVIKPPKVQNTLISKNFPVQKVLKGVYAALNISNELLIHRYILKEIRPDPEKKTILKNNYAMHVDMGALTPLMDPFYIGAELSLGMSRAKARYTTEGDYLRGISASDPHKKRPIEFKFLRENCMEMKMIGAINTEKGLVYGKMGVGISTFGYSYRSKDPYYDTTIQAGNTFFGSIQTPYFIYGLGIEKKVDEKRGLWIGLEACHLIYRKRNVAYEVYEGGRLSHLLAKVNINGQSSAIRVALRVSFSGPERFVTVK